MSDNYEKIVSAKIIPAVDCGDQNIIDTIETTYGNLRNTINDIAREFLKQGGKVPLAKKLSVLDKVGDTLETVSEIAISSNEEGYVQATLTKIGANNAGFIAGTIVMGIGGLVFGTGLAATIGGIIVGNIVSSYVSDTVGKLLDDKYNELNFREEFDIWWDNKFGKAIIDTSISNVVDLRGLVAPLYGTAKDCDLNEIEIRVRPENENDETIVYTIEKGDTVWDLCQKYDTTYDELIELNPWLADRFSDDMSFALIRPGEKLRIPCGSSGLLGDRPTFDVPFDEAAGAGTPGADPILVDLNGDGKIETTSVENGINFDHRKDGFAETSAWVSKEDGVLVIDKNNDGVINNGGEIFGDNYIKKNGSKASNGFDALRDLDSNNDEIISLDDTEFSNIKILKGDGELVSLEEAGIVSINLNSTSKNAVDENGNTLVSSGTFVRADGTTGDLGDFNLVVDKMMSTETGKIKVSEDVSMLPDIRSLGYVHSLHQAMMRDGSGELKQLVNDFIAAIGETAKKNVVKQILYKWTGADKVTVASGGYHYDGQKLYVIEQFIGEEFKGINNDGYPNVWAAPLLDNSYNQIAEYVYYQLMVQTDEHIKSLYNMIEIEYSFEDDKVSYNFDKVIEYIDNELAEDETIGISRLLEATQIIKAFGIDKQEGYDKYFKHFNELKEEYGGILNAINKLTINGTDEADVIEGTAGADAVFAGEGNDDIKTRQGDDLVYGGNGDDTIDTCEGNDLVYGEDGNDSINAGYGSDTVYGGNGDDTITAGEGWGSYLDGGDGNDRITIKRTQGVSTTVGGRGNDYIEVVKSGNGAISNATYKYDLGDGNDTIKSYLNNDTIVFGEGITKENIITETIGENLKISFNEFDGSITINKAATNVSYRVENFKFADGTSLTYDELIALNNSSATSEVSCFANSEVFANEDGFSTDVGVCEADINKIIQDMTAYDASDDAMISYTDDVNKNQELLTLVNS